MNELDVEELDSTKRTKKVKGVALYLVYMLKNNDLGWQWGLVYLFCNLLNVMNVCLQAYLIDRLLNNNGTFYSYGYKVNNT